MRALLIAVVLAALAARPAAADGIYFTESLGGADVKDELGQTITSAMKMRVAFGYRRGAWALEAFAGGYLAHAEMLYDPCWTCDGSESPTASLGIFGLDLKYLQPLSRRVEGYLRFGLSGAVIEGSALNDYRGRGVGLGAGVQLKGKVRALGFVFWPLFFAKKGPKVTGALWLDTGYDLYRLHPVGDRMGSSVDARIVSLAGGFALGSDF